MRRSLSYAPAWVQTPIVARAAMPVVHDATRELAAAGIMLCSSVGRGM
jgi:hypothetical protein